MIFAKPPIQRMAKYAIFRIISDDLPPRDEPGSRLKVLKFILDNEPVFENTIKCWVVNSFFDRVARQEFLNLLAERDMYAVVLPLARIKYKEATTRDAKIVAAIGINRARNLAVQHGHILSEFTAVLDGDCYFTKDQWNDLTSKIEQDQIKTRSLKHYSVPCSRSTFEHALHSSEPMALAEPMPLFRYDSNIFFNEDIPFGKGDKLEFLFRLNHSKEPGRHHEMLNESLCKCFGLVHHLSGSSYEIETDLSLRVALRNKSIDLLLNKIDNFVPPEKMPNDHWKHIRGFFDFQGLYSHFVFDHGNGAKFVEVGCWLGASTSYLATEIKNRQKQIEFYAVDTWLGSNEPIQNKTIENLGGPEALFYQFNENIRNAGVSHLVKPMRMTSVQASQKFEDESLDVVFIDACHRYPDVLEDIKSWYPKIKKGGKIAGHDYLVGNKISEGGVIRAVNEFFKGKNLEISPAGRTWLHKKK